MYPILLASSTGVKLRVMLFGESIILFLGSGGGGAYESEYDVALVPENDLAVEGRDDEKLLLRSLRNMVSAVAVDLCLARTCWVCVCIQDLKLDCDLDATTLYCFDLEDAKKAVQTNDEYT